MCTTSARQRPRREYREERGGGTVAGRVARLIHGVVGHVTSSTCRSDRPKPSHLLGGVAG